MNGLQIAEGICLGRKERVIVRTYKKNRGTIAIGILLIVFVSRLALFVTLSLQLRQT